MGSLLASECVWEFELEWGESKRGCFDIWSESLRVLRTERKQSLSLDNLSKSNEQAYADRVTKQSDARLWKDGTRNSRTVGPGGPLLFLTYCKRPRFLFPGRKIDKDSNSRLNQRNPKT